MRVIAKAKAPSITFYLLSRNLFLKYFPMAHIITGVNGGIYMALLGLKKDTIIIIAKIIGIAIALNV